MADAANALLCAPKHRSFLCSDHRPGAAFFDGEQVVLLLHEGGHAGQRILLQRRCLLFTIYSIYSSSPFFICVLSFTS